MDDDLRLRLIEALTNRRWTHLDAERAGAFVAGLYKDGEGEWKIWQRATSTGAGHYRVARSETADAAYDSMNGDRALDVAKALNELERHGSAATGTP